MTSLDSAEQLQTQEESDGVLTATVTPEQWEVEGQFIAEQLELGVIPATVTSEQWEIEGQYIDEQIVIQLEESDVIPATLTPEHFEVEGQFVAEQIATPESGVIPATVTPEQLQVEGQFVAEQLETQEQSGDIIPATVAPEQFEVEGQFVAEQLETQGELAVIPATVTPEQFEVEGRFIAEQIETQEESGVIPATVTPEQFEVEGQFIAEQIETQEESGVIPATVTPEQFEVEGQFVAEQIKTEEESDYIIPTTVTPEQLEVEEPTLSPDQNNGVGPPDLEGPSKKYILLPRTVKVKCGGCGKEGEVNDDASSPDLTEASYICDICKSRAQKKLRLHQLLNGGTFAQEPERSDPKPQRKHPCPHCYKEFNSQKDMKRHTNIHTGLRPYPCDICGKAFSQSCSLKRHQVTHTDAKPHRCEVCGLTFRGHLARHMRSHTGEKPFVCEICQKGFYRSELLKRHLAEHMTDGTVSCSKTKLDDIFQRSLVKQHTCLICDKTYTNGGHLARHMKQHNNENVLRCGVCTKVFYVKEELQEHLQGHSKEDLAAIIAASTLTLMSPMTNGSPNSSTFEDPSPYTSGVEDIPMEEDLPPEDSALVDYPSEDYHQGNFPQEDFKQGDFPHRDLPHGAPPPESVPQEHACLEDRVTCGICGHACCCTNYIPVHMENHEEAMVQCRSCGMDFPPTRANNGSQICSLCKPQEAKPEADNVPGNIPEDIPNNVHNTVQDGGLDDEDEEKRYKCMECDKTYKFIKHLKDHARVHGGGYRPYRCNTCGKAFTKRYHLNRHQLIHGRPLQRPSTYSRIQVAPKRKVGRPRLTERRVEVPKPAEVKHVKIMPPVAKPHVELKPFVEAKEYLEAKTNAGGLPFVCSACGKVFPKRVPLKRHLLNHLHDGTIPKDHPQLDEMKVYQYVNAHTGEVPSPQLRTCPICGKVCKGLHLDRHMKVHTPEEIAKNKESSAVGASPQLKPQQPKRQQMTLSSGLDQGEMDYEKDMNPLHDEGSDDEGSMQVDGSMMVGNDDSLNVKEEEQPEEVKPHECLDDKVTCGICGHSCCCANYITVHMETHADDSDNCGKCGKELGDLPSTSIKGTRICSICTSRSRKQLRLHQILRNRVINQESSYSAGVTRKRIQCSHCPKSFVERKNFREHLRIHTGEKRHHCSICGMGFVNSRNFKRHVWKHTGEKPNWCNVCNKGIAGHLARHMRSHSDQKSYVCNMCHKGFNRSEHLKRHLKTHLGSLEEFQCHLCDRKYLRKEHLKRHIRSHEDGTLELQEEGSPSELYSPAKPKHPPVNDQPFKEHQCTYDIAVCGLCGDACCCGNYIPFHMEVHGEKAEDYLDGQKKDLASNPKGDGEKPVKDHSCTYDAVTCGLCGEACCCANYIPLHMELHGQKATDPAKDHIVQNAAEDDARQKTSEAPQAGLKEVEEHPCMHDLVTCGICGEACCCANYMPFHMELHDAKAPESIAEEDILKKANDVSQIGDNNLQAHPCAHEIAICGICGEPCCCANYIPFHMELHKEPIDQEPMDQDEIVCVANQTTSNDHVVADKADAVSSDSVPEVPAAVVQAPEAAVTQAAAVAPGPAEGRVVNNGEKVAAEHVEEFDWASVANFLQGNREPGPLAAPPLLASGSTMEPSNRSPIKAEPTPSHVEDHPVTDHECLHTQVTCETCGHVLCCINNLITHLDTHKSLKVRCEVCHLDVDVTRTVTVLKDGAKIYKCGTCVMGVSSMSMSPARGMTKVREREARGGVDKCIPCPHCDRVLKSRKELTRHVKIHADVKPFKCDLCDKEFTAMANLRRHLDAHAGVKPHECQICGQYFSGHMARHMRTHTGEKKYTCEICSKGFHRLEHLKRHLGQHLREGSSPSSCKQLLELGITDDPDQSEETSPPSRANWCHICEKDIQGRLARHMRTHSGVKPFECSQCDKAFYRSEHLKRHLEVHAKREQGVPSIL